ncbi:MAG: FKBP-type peptidyl-prolyl cis-trans isomerase [Treponema sp.]|nr:FKBP-type peptidyl-prolyl cis-trans isomerase [Treponema sp.]
MKHTIFVILTVAVLCAFVGCDKFGGSSAEETFDKDTSYALGMDVGRSLKADNLYPNLDAFAKGIKDALHDNTRFTMEEAYQILNDSFRALSERREEERQQLADKNKQDELDFLAENSQKPGITVTESGLQYEVIIEGNGDRPTGDNVVQVHYEGALVDGTVFDSSYPRGEPVEFPLGGVIPGWTEGLQLMDVGSKYRLVIPSELGYGQFGMGQQIPPYSTLIFEVELLGIVR